MRKLLVLVALCVLSAFLTAGCGGGKEEAKGYEKSDFEKRPPPPGYGPPGGAAPVPENAGK